MIRVLRNQPMRRLRRALDRAVTREPSLAPARAAVLRPLELLEALATDAEGALGNDGRAAERLRLMIAMSAARSLELKRMLDENTQPESGSAPTALDTVAPPPCEPGVIDIGALVVVGLAAGRVGRRTGLAGAFVDTVLACALWAAPAEALVRSLSQGLTDDQLIAMLGGLAAEHATDARNAAVVPLFLDVCERARWRCLDQLFGIVREQARNTDWEGALASPIESVELVQSEGSSQLLVKLREAGGIGPKVGEPSIERDKLLEELDKLRGHVVLASATRPPIAVVPRSVDAARSMVIVDVPDDARAGWVGVTTNAVLNATRKARAAVRKRWIAENESSPCLRDSPVPVTALAIEISKNTTPPFSPTASWGLRLTEVVLEQDGQEQLRAGRDTHVIASFSPGNVEAVAELEVAGHKLPMEVGPGTADTTLRGELVAHGVEATVRLHRAGVSRPDDERALTIEIADEPSHPASAPSHGVTAASESARRARLAARDDETHAGSRPIAFVRPALLLPGLGFDRVSLQVVSSLVDQLGLHELVFPWLGDEDLVIEGAAEDPDSPAVNVLFERLTRISARSTGFENAVLVGLVPTLRSSPLWIARDGDHVAKLIVANLRGIQRQLEQEPVAPTGVATSRLRIAGSIRANDVALFDRPRIETRHAGPGATFPTDFMLVGTDRDGREIVTRRIRTASSSRAGVFSVLMPVSDDVVAAAIRYEPELLAIELHARPTVVTVDLDSVPRSVTNASSVTAVGRFGTPARRPSSPLPVLQRPPGTPTLVVEGVKGREIHWSYSHDRGIRARIDIELGLHTGEDHRRRVWIRVAEVDAALGSAVLPLDRLGPGLRVDAVRLVASDGWNAAFAEASLDGRGGGGGGTLPSQPSSKVHAGKPLLIRRASRGRFWSDLAHPPGPVTWSIAEVPDAELVTTERGALVEVPSRFVGKTLVARISRGENEPPFEDSIVIPG
jgi:hypothetical protein